jgi:hypothetical protein
LPHIFEPFFTTKREGGTGLGLASVYGIVAQSRGGVGVETTEHEGTTVVVYLPSAEGSAPEQIGPAADGESAVTATVLVVEDEPAVRDLVARVLTADGHRILTAATPHRAEVLFDADPEIDLLLTDVVMPGISGFELARRLQERRPDLRLLYISGYTGSGSDAEERPAGELLRKPFAPDQLSAAVRRALGPA